MAEILGSVDEEYFIFELTGKLRELVHYSIIFCVIKNTLKFKSYGCLVYTIIPCRIERIRMYTCLVRVSESHTCF